MINIRPGDAKVVLSEVHGKSFSDEELIEFVKFESTPTDDPRQRRPDITLAKTLLSWSPKVHLHKGIKKMVTYARGSL